MKIFGTHDENTLAQLTQVAERARKVALMADGHLGYVMPIGGVAAYDNAVSVVGVGFDIACGNAAIRTDMNVADLGETGAQANRRLIMLADEISEVLSFGVGRKNQADDAPIDDPLFERRVVGRGAREAPSGAAGEGTPAARYGGKRQPLRGRVRR